MCMCPSDSERPSPIPYIIASVAVSLALGCVVFPWLVNLWFKVVG